MSGDLFAAVRERLDRTLVALDFDGTLAPIVARPEDARPAPGAVGVLRGLARRSLRVAVVSGRAAEVVVELGGLAAVPGIVVLGHYGMERWSGGALSAPPPAPGVAVVRAALPGLLPEGLRIEDKALSVVVHARGLPDPDGALAALDPALGALAADNGLEVVPGRAVRELRPPGTDKGGALGSLVHELEPGAVVVAGDDVGDLPLFAVASGLGVPCVRIAVSGADADPAVGAAADVTVADPAALLELLATL